MPGAAGAGRMQAVFQAPPIKLAIVTKTGDFTSKIIGVKDRGRRRRAISQARLMIRRSTLLTDYRLTAALTIKKSSKVQTAGRYGLARRVGSVRKGLTTAAGSASSAAFAERSMIGRSLAISTASRAVAAEARRRRCVAASHSSRFLSPALMSPHPYTVRQPNGKMRLRVPIA